MDLPGCTNVPYASYDEFLLSHVNITTLHDQWSVVWLCNNAGQVWHNCAQTNNMYNNNNNNTNNNNNNNNTNTNNNTANNNANNNNNNNKTKTPTFQIWQAS